MQPVQRNTVSIPIPSQWGIHAVIAERPIVWGILIINSIMNNRVDGTINFRGRPIPINGYWDENTKQIRFNSPYAAYAGQLTMFDDPSLNIRHFILSGQLIMTPPSLQAGQQGNWIATTDQFHTGSPISASGLPPVGVFLTSNLLYGNTRRN